jgi:hypothetical protein
MERIIKLVVLTRLLTYPIYQTYEIQSLYVNDFEDYFISETLIQRGLSLVQFPSRDFWVARLSEDS